MLVLGDWKVGLQWNTCIFQTYFCCAVTDCFYNILRFFFCLFVNCTLEKKNTEALFTYNEVCLGGGVEKTKYVFTCHEQNAGNIAA
jgi:hypothetical protein